MDLAHALDGLDTHPWADTTHAYGSAEDLPELLRALAGDDEEAADEAVSELYGSVLHQGTVYAATADVAPFLARIAAAGHKSADLLRLLGDMAGSDDEYGVEPGTVRKAVTAQLPLITPTLDDPDPAVRQAAVWAVAQTRASHTVLPALLGRWDTEREPLVRAELLGAIAGLDPAAGATLAQAALGPEQPAHLRLAAVFARLDAGEAWDAAHHRAMLLSLPASPLGRERLDLDRAEPLCAVVEELLRRGTDADTTAAGDLLDAALRDERADVRAEAAWAAGRACQMSRSAPERLLPALLPLVTAGDARGVLSLLGKLGPIAAEAAPALVQLAEAGHDDDLADRALGVLALVAPDRAAPLLARGLGKRPWGLDAAAGFRAPQDVPFPFHPELLTAVRARLAEDDLTGNEPIQLMRLLRQWGGRAADALPELYELLTRFPLPAAPAVAAIAAECPPGERRRAAEALRAQAPDGPLPVAEAHFELTGETDVLLARLAKELSDASGDAAWAAQVAGRLGAAATGLADALRGALSGADAHDTSPVLDADVALADALWRITGDAETVVAVLDSVFARASGEYWFRWTAIRAARAAALLGPAGRPLVPRLTALLDEPAQAPAAVLALAAVAGPDTLDRPALADTVLSSAEQEAGALEACDALLALGADALSADHVRRLTDLAERDLRVIRSGVESEIVRADERLRARAREVLAALCPDRTG
ncbi:HEAT repeat domain-containing protein [Streptomyces sp. NPDC002867]